MENLIFNFFATLSIISGIMVIFSKNPVQSVLFLVLVFINASGILILLQADFLALLFLVVYVGAIAVLFLFVVMILAPKTENKPLFDKNLNLPIGTILLVIFTTELFLLIQGGVGNLASFEPNHVNWLVLHDQKSHLESLGQVLYTYYFFEFLLAGFVLLVSMIGAILLSLHKSRPHKKQEIYEQISRNVNEAVFNIKVLWVRCEVLLNCESKKELLKKLILNIDS